MISEKELEETITLKKQEILLIEKSLKRLENLHTSYDFIKFTIASPENIRSWAQKVHPRGYLIGEVSCPDTINFRTHSPEKGGLFCEEIFGPVRNWRCRCGDLKGLAFQKICPTCGVELTESRVRRYRMGYIQLACPILHNWYFKGVPNYILYFLRYYFPKITFNDIEGLVYCREGTKFLKEFIADELEFQKKKQEKQEKKLKVPRGPKLRYFLAFFVRDTHLKGVLGKYFKEYNTRIQVEGDFAKAYCIRTVKKNILMEKLIEEGDEEEKIKLDKEKEKKKKKKEEEKIEKERKKQTKILERQQKQLEKDRKKKDKTIISDESFEENENINFDVLPKSDEKIKEDFLEINFLENETEKIDSNNISLMSSKKTDFFEFNFPNEKISFEDEGKTSENYPLLSNEELAEEFKKISQEDPEELMDTLGVLKYLTNEQIGKMSMAQLDAALLNAFDDFEEFPKERREITRQFNKDLLGFDPRPYDVQVEKSISFRKGAEIVQAILQHFDPEAMVEIFRKKMVCTPTFKKIFYTRISRFLRIFKGFAETKTNPGWMVLTCLPVLPPTLRPFVEIESGRLIAADVNELYRLVISRNERLALAIFRFQAPDSITIFNRQFVQEAVDCLIDNARVSVSRKAKINEKPLRGLTEVLEGKFGRFRNTLLGKRVDYSARSVIVVNPQLRLNQCGLPYDIAIELLRPFLAKKVLKKFLQKNPSRYKNFKKATLFVRKDYPILWRWLEKMLRKSIVLLNRAPTLHKFGIQAFTPFPILGQAIQLHPLVCTGFNADFDGDQMAVHLPLYKTTQLEIRTMMKPSSNILSPANSEVILKPSQDIVIGCYYLTLMITNQEDFLKSFFSSENDVIYALSQKQITIHTPILIRYSFRDFVVFFDDGKLRINKKSTYLIQFDRYFSSEILEILKVFRNQQNFSKIYLLTNLGIFFATEYNKNHYYITDFFFETTPGRLIFSQTIMNFFPSPRKIC